MGEVTPEKQAEYNRTYYESKKADIREARRKRYKEDPEYRQRVRQAALLRKRKLAEDRRKGGTPKKARRGPPKPKEFRIPVGDTERTVKMYSAGQLAARLTRKTQTIRSWEKKGILPSAIYRSESNDRLYTDFQVRELVRAYTEAIRDFGTLAKTRIAQTSFPGEAKRIWREYPLGIDPAE